jgi:pyruvate,water dikinase
VRAELDAAHPGLRRPGEFFVDQLAQGVGTIAAAFYPKPVVVRLSDFKSNEYASLLGGRDFEFHEENPMIGLRGASRYTHPSYAEAFALECRAMRRVREDMGLTNVKLMIPFCRRVEEGERVLAEMAKHGLRRGELGLEVLVMCEIPNNVVRIDAFCAALRRHLHRLQRPHAADARGRPRLGAGGLRVRRARPRRAGDAAPGGDRSAPQRAHSAICGQAPSDHPEVAAFLVELGIDALSLNPDSVLQTTLAVLEIERAQGARKG